MLRSNLCDYSDACIVVKGRITVEGDKMIKQEIKKWFSKLMLRLFLGEKKCFSERKEFFKEKKIFQWEKIFSLVKRVSHWEKIFSLGKNVSQWGRRFSRNLQKILSNWLSWTISQVISK